ncbi:MAG: FAD-dependent oxidoreductase, partial [Burkholderiaceae bacterium]
MVQGTKGSLWEETAAPSTAWPQLKGDLVADIAVVGGGYTGCAAALAAASAGARVVLLESHD